MANASDQVAMSSMQRRGFFGCKVKTKWPSSFLLGFRFLELQIGREKFAQIDVFPVQNLRDQLNGNRRKSGPTDERLINQPQRLNCGCHGDIARNPNKELAGLIADEETDITGAEKVDINDGTTKEEEGLPGDEVPSKLAEEGSLPTALNEGTPPMAPRVEHMK